MEVNFQVIKCYFNLSDRMRLKIPKDSELSKELTSVMKL